MINIAIIAPYLLTLDYAALERSLCTFCRPGGTVSWTECELPTTTSPAFESLMVKTCQALHATGHTFIPPSMWDIAALFEHRRREAGHEVRPYESRHLGITPMLCSWLRQAGYQHISSTPYAIKVSADTSLHQAFLEQVSVYMERIKPFVMTTRVISESAFEDVISDAQIELKVETFCGFCLLLSVWG